MRNSRQNTYESSDFLIYMQTMKIQVTNTNMNIPGTLNIIQSENETGSLQWDDNYHMILTLLIDITLWEFHWVWDWLRFRSKYRCLQYWPHSRHQEIQICESFRGSHRALGSRLSYFEACNVFPCCHPCWSLVPNNQMRQMLTNNSHVMDYTVLTVGHKRSIRFRFSPLFQLFQSCVDDGYHQCHRRQIAVNQIIKPTLCLHCLYLSLPDPHR